MPRTLSLLATALLLLAVCSMGCQEEVTDVSGSDRVFSLYGVLRPNVDTQAIRVYPLRDQLEPLPAESLAARFTSTDQQTGRRRVWRDSVIQGTNDLNVHVFYAPFRAKYGHTYDLNVERPAGQASSATVSVPPRTDLEVGSLTGDLSARHPKVSLHGVVEGAPRLINVEPTYDVRAGTCSECLSHMMLPGSATVTQEGNDWHIQLHLSKTREATETLFRGRGGKGGKYCPQYGVRLMSITLRVVVANSAWDPPNGEFDLDVLSYPGTLSNVEGGFGFVGAGYPKTVTWRPPDEEDARAALQAAEYRTVPYSGTVYCSICCNTVCKSCY